MPFNWAWHITRTGRSTLARAGRQSARAMELTLAAMALSEGIFREAATTRWMYSSGWAFLYMLRTNFSVNSRRLVWTCLYIPTMVVMNWGLACPTQTHLRGHSRGRGSRQIAR